MKAIVRFKTHNHQSHFQFNNINYHKYKEQFSNSKFSTPQLNVIHHYSTFQTKYFPFSSSQSRTATFDKPTNNFNFLLNNSLTHHRNYSLQVENAKYFANSYKSDVRYQIDYLQKLSDEKLYSQLIEHYHELDYNLKLQIDCRKLYLKALFIDISIPKTQTSQTKQKELIKKRIQYLLSNVNLKKIPLLERSPLIKSLVNIIISLMLLIFIYITQVDDTAKETLNRKIISVTHKLAEDVPTTFDDVLGIDEIKDEILVFVEYLKDPKKFDELGAKLPKGILLTGEPGTGKTLLARAIAGEAKVPFFYTSGSSFDEIFVGVGSSRVRELIDEAKSHAPCIVFIDEIDSLGVARGKVSSGKDGTLNQLLSELDGFDQKSGIILIGATNLPDRLDKALTRPGRFDRIIHIPKPDIKGRKEILDFYLKKVSVTENINTNLLAKATMGMTGAELSNMVNLASIKAARRGLEGITTSLIEEAFDDVIMGFERKSAFLTETGKRSTAYHEAGHAICTYYLNGKNAIRKVTIVPRGLSLGMVAKLPQSDDERMSKREILSSITIALGGRVGELVFTGEEDISTGASSDFEAATYYARTMALQCGMDDSIGPISMVDQKYASRETKRKIDKVIFDMIHDCYKKAEEIIHAHKEEHELLVFALEQYETLTGEEIDQLINYKITTNLTNSEIVNLLRPENRGQ